MAKRGGTVGMTWSPLVVARAAHGLLGRGLIGRLRVPAVSLLLALTLLVGPGGPLAAGLGIGPDLARAQGRIHGDTIRPNHAAAGGGTRAMLHLPPRPAVTTRAPGAPQPITHAAAQPQVLGAVPLDPAGATRFVDATGTFQIDVPAGAVTPADVAAAGGRLSLQVALIAPPAGSNAGGSGIASFGSYLIQVVDARGQLAGHGLGRPAMLRVHLAGPQLAFDLGHAVAVFNGSLPATLTTQTAATAAGGLAPTAATAAPVTAGMIGLGRYHTTPARLEWDASQRGRPGLAGAGGTTLVVPDAISTPSTSMTWNTSGAIAYFGKPDPFNVDLSAGSLTGSVPIDVPAGPGGLTPPVALAYGSAGVAENHSVQGATGWVGEGWTLSMGSISWAEHNVSANCTAAGTCGPTWESSWQLSDPYGTAAELIPPDVNVATYYDDSPYPYCAVGGKGVYACPITWHTAPETHAKIVEYIGAVTLSGMSVSPPCFRVWLTNGIMEEFGCTTDSLEYYVVPDSNPQSQGWQDFVSSWQLDLVTDPAGNQIHFTYQRDMATKTINGVGHSYPRDTQLDTIEWDSPGCHDAQNRCTGGAWAPLMRVLFQATHTVDRVTGNPDGYACDTGPNLRCDDPLDLSGSGGLAAPDVQTTYVLNDAYVEVGGGSWKTLRTYELSYEVSGPHGITDGSTGKSESVAGPLDLTQVAVYGADGATTLPARTYTYTSVNEYYEDDTYTPNPTTNCGKSWNTGHGDGCILWAYSESGNSRYLATADNGMGLHQAFTWADARNNTHGVPSGSSPADPLACDGHESGGYPCDEADDQDWSHAILTREDDSVIRATQSGQGNSLSGGGCTSGGTLTCTTITSPTVYTYQLTTGLRAQECGDCAQGMYWGNQNEGDYLDYYNGKFMGFAQAAVSLPDGSLQVHYYDATEGWGVYDTGKVSCASSNMQPIVTTCHAAPWWDVTNAAHGHEIEVDEFATDGQTLLRATATAYTAVCPPSQVAGTPTDYGNWDGQLVSEQDANNPVAACDVQTTRTDRYTYDGSCPPITQPLGAGRAIAICGSATPHEIVVNTYETATAYGRLLDTDRQSNGGSPWEVVDATAYTWKDSVSATASGASGSYLIDLPAYTAQVNGGDTARVACEERSYDGQAYGNGVNNPNLTDGLVTSDARFAGGCGSAPSWSPVGPALVTGTGYDAFGDPMGTTDGDANAGDATHLGCQANGITFSACTGYAAPYDSLPSSSANALNQISATGYTATTDATGGYGLWATATTDPNGQTTAYAYDPLGRMTGRTLPGDTSATTTWAYDDWCASTGAQAPCVEVVQTQRLTSTATVTTRAFYDGAGRLVETRAPAPGGQDVVHYRYYDVADNDYYDSAAYFVTATSGCGCAADYSIPDSSQVGATMSYDGLGRAIQVTDAVGHVTTTSYTAAQGLNGDTGYYERTAVVDPLGHQTATLTDAFGREGYAERYTGNSPSTYALYASTRYYYNLDGSLASFFQPNGASTSFSYDGAGRQTGLVDPDRGSETYTYDADGNRLSSVDARGAAGTVWAGYDPIDRQLWRNTTNTSTGAYVTYTYDSTAGGNQGIGHLTGEHFSGTPGGPDAGLSGSYGYVYDVRGQTTGITETVGSASYTLGATYDDAGDLTSQKYPDGETVTNSYGAQGWLQSIQAQQGSTTTTLLSNLTYGGPAGPYGAVTGASVGDDIYTYSAGYDLLLRPTTTLVTRARDGATEFYQSRTYDAGSGLTGLQTDLQGQTDYQAFCYDEQSRLTWASSVGGSVPCGGTNPTGTLTSARYTQSFGYDNLDRLTSGPLGAYTYGDSHHLHAATAIGGTWTAAYDAAGDMTCRAPTSATTCSGGSPTGAPLSYDNEGQLIQWQSAPGGSPSASATYLYDGEGHRVEAQTTQSGTTTTTAYVGGLEEVSTTGTQTVTTTYYYAGSQRIALAINGVFSYLASDQIGTANVALDANGNTTAAMLAAPYGTTRYASGVMPGSYGFTGQHSDATTTGLDYYGARYYDPVAGQFASADTAPDGLDRYAYVGGNPETSIDPTGHFDFQDVVWCAQLCSFIVTILKGILGAPGGMGTLPKAFRPAPRSGPPTAQQYEEGYTQSQSDPQSGGPGATGGHTDPTNSDGTTPPGGNNNDWWRGNSGSQNKGSSNRGPNYKGNMRQTGRPWGPVGGNRRTSMFKRVDAIDPAGIYVPTPVGGATAWQTLQLPTVGNDTPTTSQSGWEQFWSGVGQWVSSAGQSLQEWWNQPSPQPQQWCACGSGGPGGRDDGEGDPGDPYGGEIEFDP